jgi:hypothetical protein
MEVITTRSILGPADRGFRARAAAPGKVVYIGWDNWSGNTIVISRANGTENADRFPPIYMHFVTVHRTTARLPGPTRFRHPAVKT